MRKTITAFLLLAGFIATAQVKIGENPTTISPGAALEIESTSKGFVIPRVANTAAVLNPVNGMIIYDISSQCFKGYQNNEWSGCGMTLGATVSILAQIGAEGDNPNIVPSQITTTQLYSLGVTGVIPANEVAYQHYIDNHPDLFSNPATLAEVQSMINTTNANVYGILAQIGVQGDNPDTIICTVTAPDLVSIGITGVDPGNEVAYQDYIDTHPDLFSNPATLSEVQTMVYTVNNTVTSVLAQIGTEGDSPDMLNSVVTVVQLQSIGVTGVIPANEVAYQDYIDNNPNSFSAPATLAEVQAMITAVNTAAPTSGGTATVSAFTCNTASAGTLAKGTTPSGVTQTITATVTIAGTYHITAAANGITFSGNGTFAGTGSQNIVLTASGTPATAGSNNFTLSTTPNCSFMRDTIDPTSGGTAVVSGFTCNTASSGNLFIGKTPVSVTQTITASVTTAGTYNISALANGITFSGSGTFAGTGSQIIVLTATGTPTATGTNSFTLNTTPNCSFNRTTNSIGITALTCGSAAQSNPSSTNTGYYYNQTVTIPYTGNAGITVPAETVSSTGITGLTATMTSFTAAASGTITFSISGTPSGDGTASFAFTTNGVSCTVSVTTWLLSLSGHNGSSVSNPSVSCNAIKTNFPSSTDGVYWVDADAFNSPFAAQQVYCDMTTDGGGWQLLSVNGTTSYSSTSTATVLSPSVGGWLPRTTVIAMAMNATMVQLRSGNSASSYANKLTSVNSTPIAALQSSSAAAGGAGTWHNGAMSGGFTINSGTWCATVSGSPLSATGWPIMYHSYNNSTCVHWWVNTVWNRGSTVYDLWSTTWIK